MIERHWMTILSVFCLGGLTGCSNVKTYLDEQKIEKEHGQKADFLECYEANIKRVKSTKAVAKANFHECLDYAESKSHAEEKLITETINQLVLTEQRIQLRNPPKKRVQALPQVSPASVAMPAKKIKLIPINFGQGSSKKEPPVAKVFPYIEAGSQGNNSSIKLPPIWKELGGKKKPTIKAASSQPRLINASWGGGVKKPYSVNTKSSYSSAAINTWSLILQGYKLKPYSEQPRVQKLLESYAKRPKSLRRLSSKAAPFLPLILKEVMDRNMPTEFALLPLVESGFSTTALSHASAAGLWQFIPATGKRYGLKQTKEYDGRLNIIDSTNAALDYLEDLNKQFDGDWLLALAAYNAGEGRVAKAVARQLAKGGKTDFWSLKLPTETMLYVPRLLAYRELMSSPKKYGFIRTNPSPETALGSLRVNKSFDLLSISKSARIPSRDTLTRYNPNFLTGRVNPKYESEIVVPRKYIGQVQSAVKMLSI